MPSLTCFHPAGQNNAEDWKLGSRGCYDSASLARLQTSLKLAFPAFASATVAECASQRIGASVARALADETLSADPDALARLMADHTQVSMGTKDSNMTGSPVRGGPHQHNTTKHNTT
jgi:hypothetical protein